MHSIRVLQVCTALLAIFVLLSASVRADITVVGNSTITQGTDTNPLTSSTVDQIFAAGDVINVFDGSLTIDGANTLGVGTLVAGQDAAASPQLFVDAGTLDITQDLFVGNLADVDLLMSNSAVLNAQNVVLRDPNGFSTFTVDNSVANIAAVFFTGNGSLDIVNGGQLIAPQLQIADVGGDFSFNTITGAGSLANVGNLLVGAGAGTDGVLEVLGGAALNASGSISVGGLLDAEGQLRIEEGSTLAVAGNVFVGFADAAAADSSASAIFSLSSGAAATIDNNLSVEGQPSSFAFSIFEDVGTTADVTGSLIVGSVGTASLQVNDGAVVSVGGAIQVGALDDGDGSLSVNRGGVLTFGPAGFIGFGGGQGNVFVAGGTLISNGQVAVGVNNANLPGTGTDGRLSVVDGGAVTMGLGSQLVIGGGEGAFGTLSASGADSSITVDELFIGNNVNGSVGDGASGSFFLSDAATATATTSVNIGFGAGTGSALLSDGAVLTAPEVNLGFDNPAAPNSGEALSGSLSLDTGAVVQANVNMTNLATLSGIGRITGNVQNDGGNVFVGTTQRGALVVDGDYTQTDGSISLSVAGAQQGEFDQLFATNDIDLQAGSVDVSFVNGFMPGGGESLPLLAAQGNLVVDQAVQFNVGAGQAAFELEFAPGQVVDPINGGLVTANVGNVNFLNVNIADIDGLTANAGSLASNIDMTCVVNAAVVDPNADQQDLSQLCAGIRNAGNTPEQLADILEGVGTDETTQTTQALLLFTIPQHGNLSQRINGIRAGADPFDLASLNLRHGDHVVAGADLEKFLKGIIGGIAGSDDEFAKWGLFGNGNVNFGDQDANDSGSGFDYTTVNVTLGVDYRYRPDLIFGGTFSYSDVNADFDEGGGMNVKSWAASAFGSYFPTDRFYVDLLGTYGENDFDISRHVTFETVMGAVDRRADSETDGQQYSLSLGTGYDFNPGAWVVGPHGGLNYTELETDPYSEEGAGGLNLVVQRQTATSFTANLGFHVSRTFTPSWGVVIPYLQADYVREFETAGETINIRFAADRFNTDPNSVTPPIQIETDERDENYFVVSAGASVQLIHGVSGFLAYRGTYGLNDLSLADVTWGIRFERNW